MSNEIRRIIQKWQLSGQGVWRLAMKYGVSYSTIYKVAGGHAPKQIRVVEIFQEMIRKEL